MIIYSRWISLSLDTRNKIAREFGIVKKGPVEVFANTIKSDGYLVKDIDDALTLTKMQAYLGTTETDPTVLWNYLVDKMEGRNITLIDTPVAVTIEPDKSISIPIVKPFCDKCESKGVRHRKGCPYFK